MILVMKTLLIVTILLIFSGCASQNAPSPSQNDALNRVSKSNASTKKRGWMQEHLAFWLKEDWEKTTEEFEKKEKQKSTYIKTNKKADPKEQEEASKDSSTKEKSFSLQYYVNKIKYYNEHKKSSGPSHLEELEKMPVIGN